MKTLFRLSARERHTFYFMISAQIFNSISLGILLLQEFVMRKTLSAAPFMITLLVMAQPVSNLFSVFTGSVERIFPKRRDAFIFIGIAGKLILILMLFAGTPIPVLLTLLVFYIFHSMMNPLVSNMMQLNLSDGRRGFIYGISSSAGMLFMMLASLAAGSLLDMNQNLYRILFAAAGISGLVCCLFYSRIRVSKRVQEAHLPAKGRGVGKIFSSIFHILKENKEFRRYQAYFFLYGIGYLIVLPAIPIYFVDTLKLDYSQISFIKGFIGQSGYILLFPLTGLILDRLNVWLYSSGTFALLSFYPLFLLISGSLHSPLPAVYAAFAFFSISMPAVSVLWDLSSISFAGGRRSTDYQSVHIFLTGIRGIAAPLAGLAVMKYFSVSAVFGVSFLFFAVSSLLMLSSYISGRRGEASKGRTET